MRGGEGLDLSKGSGRENECSQENHDGKGAHGGLSVVRSPGTVKAQETLDDGCELSQGG